MKRCDDDESVASTRVWLLCKLPAVAGADPVALGAPALTAAAALGGSRALLGTQGESEDVSDGNVTSECACWPFASLTTATAAGNGAAAAATCLPPAPLARTQLAAPCREDVNNRRVMAILGYYVHSAAVFSSCCTSDCCEMMRFNQQIRQPPYADACAVCTSFLRAQIALHDSEHIDDGPCEEQASQHEEEYPEERVASPVTRVEQEVSASDQRGSDLVLQVDLGNDYQCLQSDSSRVHVEKVEKIQVQEQDQDQEQEKVKDEEQIQVEDQDQDEDEDEEQIKVENQDQDEDEDEDEEQIKVEDQDQVQDQDEYLVNFEDHDQDEDEDEDEEDEDEEYEYQVNFEEQEQDQGEIKVEHEEQDKEMTSDVLNDEEDAQPQQKEAEEAEKEEEEKRSCSKRPVQRSTSLKTGKTPPGTPGRKKIVRFADALGLDLTLIRTFLDEIPIVPQSAFDHLNDPKSSSSSSSDDDLFLRRREVSSSARSLIASFTQPASVPSFLELVKKQHICLETATMFEEMTIRGVVRVVNVDFSKSVVVRFTTDEWKSHTDVGACYVANSCDGLTDRFTFNLLANMLQPGQRLIFALSYRVGGKEFWDSCCGTNYVFQCVSNSNLPAIALHSPVDQTLPYM